MTTRHDDKAHLPGSARAERSGMRWTGRSPARDAFRIGVEHGAYCVGCCWSLMVVMFAVGSGSLGWMLLLALVMAAEKNLPWGRRLSGPVGFALVGTSVAVVTMNALMF